MAKKYRFRFDPWALALFALVMLPNILWFSLPARPSDVLRAPSALPAADATASIARILMLACLCFLENAGAPPVRARALTLACALCVFAYLACWALYFRGIAPPPVLWGLCLFPCAAFILFSLGRENFPALAFALVFTVCHALCTHAALAAHGPGGL